MFISHRQVFLVFVFLVLAQLGFAQSNPCVSLVALYVKPCVNANFCSGSFEGENEMVRFKVGDQAINIADITLTWPNNAFLGLSAPNATTQVKTLQYNNTVNNSCGKLIESTNGILPANADVFIVSSTNACANANFFQNLSITSYILYQNSGNIASHFTNYNSVSSNVPFTLTVNGVCEQTVSYDAAKLVKKNGSKGDEEGAVVYVTSTGLSYVNLSCQAPYEFNSALAVGPSGACPGQEIEIVAKVRGAYKALAWTANGAGTIVYNSPNNDTIRYLVHPNDVGVISFSLNVSYFCGNTLTAGATISISGPPSVSIFPNDVIVLCDGKTEELSANAGFSSYKWNTGATSNAITVDTAGTYSVSVKDVRGCVGTAQASVTIASSPVSKAGADKEICGGEAVGIGDVGDPSLTYGWSPQSFLSNPSAPNPTCSATSTTTYILITANANGCDAKDTVIVRVKPKPAKPNVPSEVRSCKGVPIRIQVTNPISGGVYKWFGPLGSLPDGPELYIANPQDLNNGSYRVRVILNGCTSDDAEVKVIIGSTPNPPSVKDTSYCKNEAAVPLSAAGNDLLWYTTQGQTAGTGSATPPQVSTNSVGTYVFYVTQGGAACESTKAKITIVVKAVPAIPNVVSPVVYCQGDATTAIQATGESGATLYYSNPIGTVPSVEVAPTPSSASVGNFVYTVLQEKNGCISGLANIEVTINPKPNVPNVQFNKTVFCEGDTLIVASNTQAGVDYKWTGPNSFTSAANSFVLTNLTQLQAGLYSLESSLGNCKAANVNQTITIGKTPTVSVVKSVIRICEGEVFILQASSSNGATFAWQGPNMYTSTLQKPIFNQAGVSLTGIYTVISRIGNCISKPQTVDVVVTQLPVGPIVSSEDELCEGDTLHIEVDNADAQASYSWSIPSGSFNANPKQQIPNIKLINAGSYKVLASKNGCKSAETLVNIVVNALPTIAVKASNLKACIGTNLVLEASSTSPGASLFWKNLSGIETNSSTLALSNVTQASAGTYTAISRLAGCTSVAKTTQVKVLELPELISFSAEKTCVGEDGKVNIVSKGLAPFKLIYSLNGVLDSLSFTNANASILYTGIGVMQFSKLSDSECVKPLNSKISLSNYAVPNAVLTGDELVCNEVSAKLKVALTGIKPFAVDVYRNGVLWQQNQSLSSAVFAFTTSDSGSYEIRNLRDSVCPGTVSGTVEVKNQVFQALSLELPGELCKNEPNIQIRNTSLPSEAGSVYSVFVDGVLLNSANAPRYAVPTADVKCYDIRIVENLSSGCKQEKFYNAAYCVSASVSANFSLLDKATIDNNIVQVLNTSAGATGYSWYLNSKLVSTLVAPQIKLPTNSQLNYTLCLSVENERKCRDTSCLAINIIDETSMYIPNAFSPDGDGYNEVFEPISGNKYLSQELRIYNRWGEQVYLQKAEKVSWNGFIQGNLAQSGIYIWRLETVDVNGLKNNYKGTVNLFH